ncbi:TetR/AcrR family transcriptional regulator [Arthrobacter sp. ZGTC131]|uniref:TetR/AcrR family transcriptional regulator n=1 Tax=Arthrobacter sp. ZGTC131 TaxID=2058898 RepID=UPI000CE3D6D1|nr:TetR family transcriptional regulator [Arthrobacter sp. ZGTC131]
MATRRFDPDRRDRIIDAALDVIAARGVAGTSHRRIAERAGVPLGSMTYHFTSMDQLLGEAFRRFADTGADGFEVRLGTAANAGAARQAVVDLIHADLLDSRRDLVLTLELYTLAAREPVFRQITRDWMSRSRHALERHFDPVTSRMLDALIEGHFIHAALDTEPHDRSVTVDAVNRITAVPPSPHDSPRKL